MRGKFFEDFAVGDTYQSVWKTVTPSHVHRFVDLIGLAEPLFESASHLASDLGHDRWMAPGILTLSLSVGLFSRSGWIEGTAVAMLGIETLSWEAPVLAGNEIRIQVECVDTTATGAEEAGVVTLDWTTENRDGETVLSMRTTHYMKKRSA
ncbi:MAG: MaoC family dehydratase [Salinirussus sp.]